MNINIINKKTPKTNYRKNKRNKKLKITTK
jgi:hypothetical protein